MKVIFSLILIITVVLGADVVYKSVHYPDNYSVDNRGGSMYVSSRNLMYSVVIFSNGSIFTVGNSSSPYYIAEIDYAFSSRVIRHFRVDTSNIEKFKNFVQESGFMTLPAAKDGDRSNKICDFFYYTRYSTHKVCRPEESNHPTIAGIESEIFKLFNMAYYSEMYRPNSIFVETKPVQYYEIVGKGPIFKKTPRMMLQEFDPEGRFMGSDYIVATFVSRYYNRSYSTFWEAANNGSIFTDDYKYFQVVVYVDGLSVNDHPPAIYTPITSFYSSYNYTNSNSTFPWTIVFFGFLFIFFTVFIIFIIRRRLRNNSFNQDDNISVEDKSESNEYEQPNNQQTSYPIFVQSNNHLNPQMTSYPIFVTTNPHMQTNGINGVNGVPIIFPQPQVFYPMQTNQMNPQ
jgi:hypothetical protein